MFTKNIHLIISIIIVIPIAIIYGFFPSLLLEIFPNTIDEHNFQKAVMGLYLAFGLLWLLGIVKPEYWKTATIANICFMLGLAFGRIISIIVDGTPSRLFIFGTAGEFVIGLVAIYQIIKFDNFQKQ